jgi:hypothetical protein
MDHIDNENQAVVKTFTADHVEGGCTEHQYVERPLGHTLMQRVELCCREGSLFPNDNLKKECHERAGVRQQVAKGQDNTDGASLVSQAAIVAFFASMHLGDGTSNAWLPMDEVAPAKNRRRVFDHGNDPWA